VALLFALLTLVILLIVEARYPESIPQGDGQALFILSAVALITGALFINELLFWVVGLEILAVAQGIRFHHRRQITGRETRLTPGELFAVCGAILTGMILASLSGAYAMLLWVSVALTPVFLTILLIYAVNTFYPLGTPTVVELEKRLRDDRREMQDIVERMQSQMAKQACRHEKKAQVFLRQHTRPRKGA